MFKYLDFFTYKNYDKVKENVQNPSFNSPPTNIHPISWLYIHWEHLFYCHIKEYIKEIRRLELIISKKVHILMSFLCDKFLSAQKKVFIVNLIKRNRSVIIMLL